MPPKKVTAKKKKGKEKSEEPPKPIPDLEWEDVPYIASTFNQIYNQKIKIRIRALFSVLDVHRKNRIDLEHAILFIRAAGLFPTDVEIDTWLKEMAKKAEEDDILYVERTTICDGVYEILRQGKWKPPSAKQAVRFWRRLDIAQRGSLTAEDLKNIFAQEEKEDGMTPTELKKLVKHVSTMPGGELDYVAYCDSWYKMWMSNRIPRPRDRMPRRFYDNCIESK